MRSEDVKNGMEVRIRTDVNDQDFTGEPITIFISDMEQYRGKKARVTKELSTGDFRLSIDDERWRWRSEWFEPVSGPANEFKKGDTVIVSLYDCHEGNGVITGEASEWGQYPVTFKDGGTDNIPANRLELVSSREFQRGDRVRFVRSVSTNATYEKIDELTIGEIYVLGQVGSDSCRLEGKEYTHHNKCFEHVDPTHATTHGTWTPPELIFGDNCPHMKRCWEENDKMSANHIDPDHYNRCDECRTAGKYLATMRIEYEEVNDMEEETLNEVCKQLNIEVVGKDSGSLILKDGRIGTIIQRKVTVTMTRAEKRAMISKLPDSVNSRAFIVEDSELSFSSYYFWDNEQPKEDVMPVETPE